MQFIQHHVLVPQDTILAAGVAYQMADVWWAELQRAVGDGKRVPDVALEHVIQPFVYALEHSKSIPLLQRITYVVWGGGRLMDVHIYQPYTCINQTHVSTIRQPYTYTNYTPTIHPSMLHPTRASVFEPLASHLTTPLEHRLQQATASEDDDGEDGHEDDGHGDEDKINSQDTFGLLQGTVLADALFQAGAGASVAHRNREALYQCSHMLQKAVKRRSKLMAALQDIPTCMHDDDQEELGGKKKQQKGKKDKQQQVSDEGHGVGEGHGGHGGHDRAEERAGKKKKKDKRGHDAAAAAPSTPPASPPSASTKQTHGTAGHTSDAAQPHTNHSNPNTNGAVKGASQPAAPTQQSPPGKKGVRWNLDNNLFFAVDGPVPDPDVRTPPGAKPKGSALKKVSALPTPKKLVIKGGGKKKRKVELAWGGGADGCGY